MTKGKALGFLGHLMLVITYSSVKIITFLPHFIISYC